MINFRRSLYYCFSLLVLYSCYSPKDEIKYKLVNNSNQNIDFYFPHCHRNLRGYADYNTEGMNAIPAYDTTLLSASKVFFSIGLGPHSSHSLSTGYLNTEQMTNYDTVRVFVTPDPSMATIETGDMSAQFSLLEKILNEDIYYVRYDYTVSDLDKIVEREGCIVLVYPPDTTMASIKMHPPYQTFTYAE